MPLVRCARRLLSALAGECWRRLAGEFAARPNPAEDYASVITAALDVIIGVWLIVYAVPVIFDQQTGALVDIAILVLSVAHIVRRLEY